MYPDGLRLDKTDLSNVLFVVCVLSMTSGYISPKIYDKRGGFEFMVLVFHVRQQHSPFCILFSFCFPTHSCCGDVKIC